MGVPLFVIHFNRMLNYKPSITKSPVDPKELKTPRPTPVSSWWMQQQLVQSTSMAAWNGPIFRDRAVSMSTYVNYEPL